MKIQKHTIRRTLFSLPIILGLGGGLMLSSCNDYLDITPENTLPTEDVWNKKSNVEAVLNSTYYVMREAITTHLIPLGELRAGIIKPTGSNNLAKLEIKSTDKTYTNWNVFYKMINSANAVLENAADVRNEDQTYTAEELNSHKAEAYFIRALAYFYLVRNWRDVPLITQSYEEDDVEYYVPQSDEATVMAQIKSDLNAAISLGAAKEAYDTKWETKGRCTVWAIYALMTDVCMWNKDFDEAITYADKILESKSPNAPQFMPTPTHTSWFSIFNPGNSNEGIFELQYSAQKTNGTAFQTNNLPTLFYASSSKPTYMLSENFVREMNLDATYIENLISFEEDMYARTRYGAYNAAINSQVGYLWKYSGGSTLQQERTSSYYDPNFIIYRVSDIMLLKAEALVMRNAGANTEDNKKALAIVNQIRQRTNLLDLDAADAEGGMRVLLDDVLQERLKELCGEGKAWYDLLRIGRYVDPKGEVDFVRDFLINNVVYYNLVAGESKVRSTLLDSNAWYLPVNEEEISRNDKLVQNPYYD